MAECEQAKLLMPRLLGGKDIAQNGFSLVVTKGAHMQTNNRFVELIPHSYLHPSEVLLAGAWDVPVARLAMHLRSARINGTAPEPQTHAAVWVDSAGVVCGMTLGVN